MSPIRPESETKRNLRFSIFGSGSPAPGGGHQPILVATPTGIVTVCLNSPGSVRGVRQPRHGGAGITHAVHSFGVPMAPAGGSKPVPYRRNSSQHLPRGANLAERPFFGAGLSFRSGYTDRVTSLVQRSWPDDAKRTQG